MHDKQQRRKRPVRKTGLEPLGCLVWLRLRVTNSLTGVERYKSDTVCIELDRSNNEPRGGVAMSDSEQLKREFTVDERRRLVDYFSLLIENRNLYQS